MMTMSATAREKIAELLIHVPEGGIRVAAILGGCAGIRYALKLARTPQADDIVVQDGAATLFIDPGSTLSLQGTMVDFVSSTGGGGFTFDNPNAIGRCSCSDPNAPCAEGAA